MKKPRPEIRPVDELIRANPHIDLELLEEFRRIKRALAQVPKAEEPEPPKQPRRRFVVPPKLYLR